MGSGEIARGIEGIVGIRLGDLKGKGMDTRVMEGRRLLSLFGREYGYKGEERAAYLEKDPASVTGYLRRGQDLQSKTERLIFLLDGGRRNLNI